MWYRILTHSRFSSKKNCRWDRLLVDKEEWGGSGTDWEFEVNRCKLLCREWINNKGLPYSTQNYIWHPGLNHNGKENEKNVCICTTESLCCPAEINTTLNVNYTWVKQKKEKTTLDEYTQTLQCLSLKNFIVDYFYRSPPPRFFVLVNFSTRSFFFFFLLFKKNF